MMEWGNGARGTRRWNYKGKINCRSGFTPRLHWGANQEWNMDKQDGRDEEMSLAKIAEVAKRKAR